MTIASGHIQNKGKVRYPDFEHGCTGLASSNLRMKPEETVIGNTYRYYFGSGYVKFSDGFAALNPQYFFYTKDHLGNVRSVVTKNHSTNEITEVQQTHYYPFGGIIADLSTGRNVQNHLYNGKELDYSNNLYWYDYGARQYDPTAPRFTTPDRYSEKYYSQNMYGYCGNNPISRIDINGDSISVTGKYTNEALVQMQEFVGDGLSLYYNNGYLCYKITDSNKLTDEAKLYMEMIDNTFVDIQISTIDNNRFMIGGAYLGHEVIKDEKGNVVRVKAMQTIDPCVLAKADSFSKGGTMITHEVTEAYEGAKIGKRRKKNDTLVVKGNKILPLRTYKEAHSKAYRQNNVYPRQQTTSKGVIMEYYVTNGNGDEVIILTQ